MKKPKTPLAVCVCRQCNAKFGPGQHHFANCMQHKNASWHKDNEARAMRLQIKYQDIGAQS